MSEVEYKFEIKEGVVVGESTRSDTHVSGHVSSGGVLGGHGVHGNINSQVEVSQQFWVKVDNGKELHIDLSPLNQHIPLRQGHNVVVWYIGDCPAYKWLNQARHRMCEMPIFIYVKETEHAFDIFRAILDNNIWKFEYAEGKLLGKIVETMRVYYIYFLSRVKLNKSYNNYENFKIWCDCENAKRDLDSFEGKATATSEITVSKALFGLMTRYNVGTLSFSSQKAAEKQLAEIRKLQATYEKAKQALADADA